MVGEELALFVYVGEGSPTHLLYDERLEMLFRRWFILSLEHR